MFKGLFSLQKLHLQQNVIHTIQYFSFSDLAQLNNFQLWDNKLSTIFEDVFNTSNHPVALNQFVIGNNPLLNCDCQMLWLLEAVGDWIQMQYKSSTICNTPLKLHGISWENITRTDLFGHGMTLYITLY